MREKNNKMKKRKTYAKLGLLFTILLILLAGISISYATWTSTITIQGTINTLDDFNYLCLQGYWSFNETSGTIAHDSSMYGNDGTVYGATWVSDGINGCLYFDGNDYVLIPSDPSLDVTEEFTIMVWVKTDTTGWGRTIITRNFGGGAQYGFRLDAGNSITGGIADETKYFWVSTKGSFPNNEWTLISLVFDKPNNQYTIYKNTDIVSAGPLTSFSRAPITGDINIGRDNRNQWYFKGYIDEVKIFSCALTFEEILHEYNSANP